MKDVQHPPSDPIHIVSNDHAIPFSKGLLAESLTATGLPPERAYRVAMEVECCLMDGGLSPACGRVAGAGSAHSGRV